MISSKAQFLELTRAGLWGTVPDVALFEGGVDWQEVLLLAKQQTLLGVVSVAIEKLPTTIRPPRAAALKMHQMVTLNRGYRAHHIEVLGKIYELLKRAGVERPVLLKGLGVGLNYIDPGVRQCGDLDIYIEQKKYESCCEFLVAELGVVRNSETEDDHHFSFDFCDTHIEIHQNATPRRNVVYRGQEFVDWSTEQLEGASLREVEIEGVKIYLPPHNYSFIYIFYHTWWHFLMGGIGLRQFCDWCRYIETFSEEFDREEIDRNIARFKLKQPIAIFSTIAVKELGLNPEKLPSYEPVADDVYQGALNKVWCDGNFGRYNPDMARRKEGFFKRKLWGLMASIKEVSYLFSINRGYAIRFYFQSTRYRVACAFKELFRKK